MMPLAIALAFLVCVIWIATRSIPDAFVNLYLPIFLLVPPAYVWDVPHAAVINPADIVLLVIVGCALLRYRRQWHFHRLDFWVLLFALGHAIPYATRLGFTVGIHAFVETFFNGICPYIAGRILIEQQGLRERVIRRMLWLLAFVATFEVLEFRLGINVFTAISDLLFPQQTGSFEQVRGGYLRAQGPFGHAITAGLIFGSAFLFAFWLGYRTKYESITPERRVLGFRESLFLPCVLFAGLFMSWSRGPWLGAAVGYAISRIAYARHVRSAMVVVLLALAIGGAGAYAYFDAYTSGDYWTADSYEQQTAIYRRELLKAYEPIVKEGGFFGWGQFFPQVEGQSSIDNEYLWLHLTQGQFGFWTFFLIFGEAALALIRNARRSLLRSDFIFSVTMLAVLCGALTTLLTVSLNVPAFQLLFLCIGWSISMRQTEVSAAAIMAEPPMEAQYPKIYA